MRPTPLEGPGRKGEDRPPSRAARPVDITCVIRPQDRSAGGGGLGLLAALFLCAAVWVTGCSEPRVSQPAEPAPPAAAAPVLAPPELELSVWYLGEGDELRAIPFDGEGRPKIEPTRQLEVRGNLPLRNARLRLFDGIDRAMVSDDRLDEVDGRPRFRIELPQPLREGHRYVLLLDAQTGSELEGLDGRSHPEQRLEFEVRAAQ